MRDINSAKYQLEALIDDLGLTNVIELLFEVCNEKAEHISESYQDEKLAVTWLQDANQLQKTAPKLKN